MNFLQLAESRYSCRAFQEKPVEEEKLQAILEAGRLAPTATNACPVRVLVLKSAESLSKIREATRMAYNAPVVLMVCYDAAKSYKATAHGDSHDCGVEDASIVATHMMLEAKERGIESLWARGFNAAEISKTMGLPENWNLVCLLDLGYADPERGGPSPRHGKRLSLGEFAREF